MSTLQHKIVVVVGGSSGIGFGVALAALQALASTVIIASSNAERVAAAVLRLQAHKLSGTVRGEVVDAKDPLAIEKFAKGLSAVDHVVWTAGDMPDPSAGGMTGPAFLTVRFWGPYLLAQHVKFNPGGSYTLTSGPSDIKPRPGMAVAGGCCAAIMGLAKGLAVDLAPVRVNVVSPGGIKTELWEKFPPELIENLSKRFEETLPIKRVGETEEIAEAYIFLMKCGYITGQRINVDGGVGLL